MPIPLSLIMINGLWARSQLVSLWKHTWHMIVLCSAASMSWSQPNLPTNLQHKVIRTLKYKKVTRDQRCLYPESTICAVILAMGLYSPKGVQPITNHGEVDSSAVMLNPTSCPKFNTGGYHRIITSPSTNTTLLTPIVYHCDGGCNCKTAIRYKMRHHTHALHEPIK
jgi:hypothetical protein